MILSFTFNPHARVCRGVLGTGLACAEKEFRRAIELNSND